VDAGEVGGVNLRRNAGHGLLGFIAPSLIVFASYPVLIRHLGAAAFGVYLLAASLSGAMMFLDMGFSAATLRFVAQDLAAGRPKAAADVVLTSLVFYTCMGVLGGAVIAALAPVWAASFKVDARIMHDAVVVFRLAGFQFAAYLPVMVFVSIAKAVSRFDRSTIFVSLLAAATYGSAVVAVLAGAGLVVAMFSVVAVNYLAFIWIAIDGLRLCRECGIHVAAASPMAFRRMFSFGWVLTVNSIAAFFLFQVQKFLVGFAMGPAAVAVYQSAAVVPSKIHAVVNAATEVMFPFASASRDRAELRRVYLRMLGGSALVALLGFVSLVALARPFLALWLGAAVAAGVAPLVPVFALAYFFLALSPAPFHLVNGLGRPALNTLACVMNALINVALIAGFALNGLTLEKFAWAFAIANVVTSIFYQATVETLIWKRDPRPAEVPA